MTNRPWRLLVLMAAFEGACGSSQPGATAGDGGGGEVGAPVDGPADAPVLVSREVTFFDFSVPPFLVVVTPDRLTGVPGTRFVLTATSVGTTAPAASYTWTAPGNFTSTSERLEVSYTTPGLYYVAATVSDATGRTAQGAAVLSVLPAASPEPAPAPTITPPAGHPGTIVRLTSPRLMDGASALTVRIGSAPPSGPLRLRPGAATALVPLEAAANLTQPTMIKVVLLDGTSEVESFDFLLSPLPAVATPPGALTRQALSSLSRASTLLAEVLPAALAPLELTPEQAGVLSGLLAVTGDGYAAIERFVTGAQAGVDPAQLHVLDQVLAAGGGEAAVRALTDFLDRRPRGMALRTRGDDGLDALCLVNELGPLFSTMSAQVQLAGAITGILSLAFPTLAPMAAALAAIATVDDLASTVLELLPQIDSTLNVRPKERQLAQGASTTAPVEARLVNALNICSKGISALLELLFDRALERIQKRMLGGQNAVDMLAALSPEMRARIVTALNIFGLDSSKGRVSERFAKFIEDRVGDYVKAGIKLAMIDKTVSDALAKVCGALDSKGTLPLGTDDLQAKFSAPNVATLTKGDAELRLTCNSFGMGTIEVSRSCGRISPRQLTGMAPLACANMQGGCPTNPCQPPGARVPTCCQCCSLICEIDTDPTTVKCLDERGRAPDGGMP
jgi:hypothetical protein